MEKNITFTDTIKFLDKGIKELEYDLCQDWLSQYERMKMTNQLALLTMVVANLKEIGKDKDAQIFKSVMHY
jgi:hypothetical protein